jgi:8-oxo-dGTP pyrophosphatase MutT (NUDIX family)
MGDARWSKVERALGSYEPRRLSPTDGERTRAAVLVPLQCVDGAVHVVYTRRAQTLPHHRGQVAFPGGTRTPADATLEATALREAAEEVGLRPADVRVLGRLDDIETVSSRFLITPFVGIVPHPYAWAPCPDEVDTIFTVPVTRLLDPLSERRELWDFGGRVLPIDHFPIDGQVIWGATHRITRNLLALVEET